MESKSQLRLSCPICHHIALLSGSEMLARLHAIGMMRRETEPDPAIVFELFESSLDRMKCQDCGATGLMVSTAPDDDDDWDDARACEICGAAIPPERLDLFPATTVCVTCKASEERGEVHDEPQFCESCGALMAVTQSRSGGISRYVLKCTEC